MNGYNFKKRLYIDFTSVFEFPRIVVKREYRSISSNGNISEIYFLDCDFQAFTLMYKHYYWHSTLKELLRFYEFYTKVQKRSYVVYSLDFHDKGITFYTIFFGLDKVPLVLDYIGSKTLLFEKVMKLLDNQVNSSYFIVKIKKMGLNDLTYSIVIWLNLGEYFDFSSFLENDIFSQYRDFIPENLFECYSKNNKCIEFSINLETSELENMYFFSNFNYG